MTAEFIAKIEATITRHIDELRVAVADGKINATDHDVIGAILQSQISSLIGLSPAAWEMFTRIVNESRAVHYNNHQQERKPTDGQRETPA